MSAELAITMIWIGVVVAFGVAAKICDELDAGLNGGKNDTNDR